MLHSGEFLLFACCHIAQQLVTCRVALRLSQMNIFLPGSSGISKYSTIAIDVHQPVMAASIDQI
jgi:hypothetical protein